MGQGGGARCWARPCCALPPGSRGAGGSPRPPQPGKAPEPHSFREKVFRRKKAACAACKEAVEAQGLLCRVCKIASHKRCEAKVTSPCQVLPLPELRRNTAPVRRSENLGSTKSLNSTRQRSTLPRTCSLERVLERRFEFELTYVTERILCVVFPGALEEGRYRGLLRELAHMLTSRHRDAYTLFNLSEKRRDIARLNPKVQEFGWPDLHAPPLDKLCSVCKALEGWLRAQPQHVAVLHCKGDKGKTGVIVAAYMHYSKISASADQALGTLTMRKFCEEKVAAALQPSQRRYINYFGGLLSGSIKMNSSTLFLHHVLVPVLPAFEPGAGYQPFLKIYQSMQLVYTSGVYSTSGAGTQSLCITLEPALLLKGDVMVKCYHKQSRGPDRDVVFRVQFHTCTIHGSQLWFGKDELDEAWQDERFPFDAAVEFVFSSGPEKIRGWDAVRNSPAVTVDYGISDPAVRWDSYEGFNVRHEDSLEERRSPGEGGPWRETPDSPSSPQGAGGCPEVPEPPGCGTPGPPSPAEAAAGATASPTPAFPLATAYYEPPAPRPPLPEKRHLCERPSPPERGPFAPELAPSGSGGGRGPPEPRPEAPGTVKFVQDTSKFWYKPGLSRDQAVALLKAKEPGSFLIRDSNSFQGAYGLALKVAAPPPNCVTHSKGDPQEQLVRHFLIETGPRGVKIKGCQNEPHFGSLPALVLQHSITPLSLPCALRIPSKDPLEESPEVPVPPNMSTAAELLRQGAACSVLYLSSVETESLTGPQAVAKAAGAVLASRPRPPACTVHFKVAAQGITLTDSQRKLFFRRHYPVGNVTYCSTDPRTAGGRTQTAPRPRFSASWPRSRAARARTPATSSPSSTPSSRPRPSSASSPRSCWAPTASEGAPVPPPTPRRPPPRPGRRRQRAEGPPGIWAQGFFFFWGGAHRAARTPGLPEEGPGASARLPPPQSPPY
ncbi:tensin-2-like isoform X3 [Rhea pennata]|uniref:tensin-2-like isoform X3 n=1 Tax=Rhea pennata TaxID=8795 RepID=UPI002E2669CF